MDFKVSYLDAGLTNSYFTDSDNIMTSVLPTATSPTIPMTPTNQRVRTLKFFSLTFHRASYMEILKTYILYYLFFPVGKSPLQNPTPRLLINMSNETQTVVAPITSRIALNTSRSCCPILKQSFTQHVQQLNEQQQHKSEQQQLFAPSLDCHDGLSADSCCRKSPDDAHCCLSSSPKFVHPGRIWSDGERSLYGTDFSDDVSG